MKQNKNTILRRDVLTRCADLRVREGADNESSSRTITGYAILFNVESEPLWVDDDSEAREVIAPEAVTMSLLDGSDIKFTMFHDRQLILARSNKGSGTLYYGIDEKGVYFEFEAPATADGDKALELVRRGDLAGCSFAFTTRYWDSDCVERTAQNVGGRTVITYRVKLITGIYDFTLAADPAYSSTSVEARELKTALKEPATNSEKTNMREQLSEMRRAASQNLI